MPLELTLGVEAAFPRESYAPGSLASLVLFKPVRGVAAQVFQAGPERNVTVGYNEMQGVRCRCVSSGAAGARSDSVLVTFRADS